MILAALIGYLLGSIPTAQIVGRICNVDPLASGDHNPGWWNMRHLVGERRALPVLVVDVAKGAAAATAGMLMWGPWWTAYVAVLFAMIGHSFPLFGRFRGGKAILTWAGGMLVLAPVAALIAIVIGVVVAVAARREAWGPLVATFSFPLFQAFTQPFTHVAWTLVLMTFIGLRFAVGFAGRIRDLSTGARAKSSPA